MVEEKKGKYTHPEVQNEYLKLMALSIFRNIAKNIKHGVFYIIMADRVTYSSSKEQFVICLPQVDKDLNRHEDFIGLHEVPNTSSSTLASCI